MILLFPSQRKKNNFVINRKVGTDLIVEQREKASLEIESPENFSNFRWCTSWRKIRYALSLLACKKLVIFFFSPTGKKMHPVGFPLDINTPFFVCFLLLHWVSNPVRKSKQQTLTLEGGKLHLSDAPRRAGFGKFPIWQVEKLFWESALVRILIDLEDWVMFL